MPLVRISILKGKSPDYIRAISDSVHQSLVEAYNVPAGDRFQLIHQHDRDEFVYDADYLGVHRTDDVVFIHVTAGKWRDAATKKALFKRLAERLAEKSRPASRRRPGDHLLERSRRLVLRQGTRLLPRGGLTRVPSRCGCGDAGGRPICRTRFLRPMSWLPTSCSSGTQRMSSCGPANGANAEAASSGGRGRKALCRGR